MILGNLLNQALSIIPRQAFTYYAFTSRVTNDVGYDVPSYADPETLYGSVQAIPRSTYQFQGLDLQKNFINVYVSKEVIDIGRDVSGDQIVFNGKRFQCESATDWYGIDGWLCILCVEVFNA